MSTIRRMQRSLYRDAEIHTPYGATECLPVSSISAVCGRRTWNRIELNDAGQSGARLTPGISANGRISALSAITSHSSLR